MKPSPLRADPAKARAFLQRGRKPLARTIRAREVRMDPTIFDAVWQRQGGWCICGCGRPIAPYPLGAHHVFPRARWPELTNEPDNWVGVAADCHASHETAARRLPRAACARAEHLAVTGAMIAYLDRTYAYEA